MRNNQPEEYTDQRYGTETANYGKESGRNEFDYYPKEKALVRA